MTARQRWLWSAVVFVGMVGVLAAQTAKPTFEVASVKRNLAGAPGPGGGPTATTGVRPGGLYTAVNVTLRMLILNVYGVREDQLIGGPKWLVTDRFDITARAGTDVPRDRVLVMVQSLIEERFSLVLRREQQERDVFALVLARSDGRLGPDLRSRSESECARNPNEDPLAATVRSLENLPRPSGGGQLWFASSCSTMGSLASGSLTRILLTTVIDKTGLAGKFDYAVARPAENADPGAAGDPNPAGLLFTAVQDSLGLKLEKQRAGVEMLVIDSVQPLTEN